MRHPLLYCCAIAALSGCMVEIHESKWTTTSDDTGAIDEFEDEDAVETTEYTVTPELLSPGINEVLTITADTVMDWAALKSVTAIGDLEIVDTKSEGDQLWVAVIVAEAAMDGPAHLIFEFDNGDVHFAREALYIEGIKEEEPADTGLLEDEPTDD